MAASLKETRLKIEAGIKTLEKLEMTWANKEHESKWLHSKMLCYNSRVKLIHLLAANNKRKD